MLRANKLSLNVKKTELVIFRPRKLKIDHSFKLELDGKRLVPTHSAKYLGVLIDKHLLWNKQIAAQIKMRPNCLNPICNMVHNYGVKKTMKQ